MPWYDRRSRRLARELYWEENDKETYQCPDCGRDDEMLLDTFDVHHKNGEVMDNREENRVGLCRVCHNLREEKKPSLRRIQHLRAQFKAQMDAEAKRTGDTPAEDDSDEGPRETITASMVFAEGVEACADRDSDEERWEGEPDNADELWEEFGHLTINQSRTEFFKSLAEPTPWEELEEMFEDDDDSEQDEDEDPWKHLSHSDDREAADG